MADIFLSYATEDRAVAGKIADMLEAAGWSVWWDRRIAAGDTWRATLERALGGMRCMVVLWSTHSVASEWVSEEAEEAKARDKPVVPALLEAIKPPLGWRHIQAVDLSDWNGSADAPNARQFIKDLEQVLGVRSGVAALPRETAAPTTSNTGNRSGLLRGLPKFLTQKVALAAGCVGVAAALGVYLLRDKPPDIEMGSPVSSSVSAAAQDPVSMPPPTETNPVPKREIPVPQATPSVTFVLVDDKPLEKKNTVAIKQHTDIQTNAAPASKPKPARCARITQQAQLGELTAEDREYLRKEC